MQTPSVGRIVHYVALLGTGTRHIAAIITDVIDSEKGHVRVAALEPSDYTVLLTPYTCDYDARMPLGTWHYPERVDTEQYHESEEMPAPNTAGCELEIEPL